jgi:gametolysin peptidase M11
VYGWYTIPDTNTSCNYTTWANDAAKAASAGGVNLSSYDNVVWAFPRASSCAWAGLGEMPGRNSWLNGYGSVQGMSLHGMAHELGHNFGTDHASGLICTQNGVKVALLADTSSCTIGEYSDPYSVTGTRSSTSTQTSPAGSRTQLVPQLRPASRRRR